MTPITIRNEELATVRDAMRGLHKMVEQLQSGEREKFVLMHRGRMVAILRSADSHPRLDMRGDPIPEEPTVRQVVELLGDSYTPEGVVIALTGRKRMLGERAPIDLLDTPEGRREAYDWARALAEGMGS